MNVVFEYNDEAFFEEFSDYLSDQVEKYREAICDSIAFLGWKVVKRPYQFAVKVSVDFDEVEDKKGELRWFVLEMVAEGKNRTKVACRLIDQETDSEVGLFVFEEFPSWDYKGMANDIKDAIRNPRRRPD